MYVAVKKEALDKVTNYLGKRPYIEVFRMFKDLQEGIKPIGDVNCAISKEQKIEDSTQEKGPTNPREGEGVSELQNRQDSSKI